jgi:hypothetical protein
MLKSVALYVLHIPREDVDQTIQLAKLEKQSIGSALDRLARELGFIRPRGYRNQKRIWVMEREYWFAPTCSYRHGAGERKKQAREKVAPERRSEIAQQGALARKEANMSYSLNVQIIPCPSEIPDWSSRVERPSQDGTISACRLDFSPSDEIKRAEVVELLDNIDRPEYRWQVNVALTEHGGGLSNTGHAHIVCGVDGKPLVSVGGLPKCGVPHARFFAHAALVIQYGQHRGNGSGTVSFVGIDRDARHRLGIVEKKLWSFDDSSEDFVVHDQMPNIAIPMAAIDAARSKARCYHCRSAFYAMGSSASGSSGPRSGVGGCLGTSRVSIGY